MPLQIAYPQHHFGNAGGAGVDFEAEKLVRVDGDALHLQQALRLPQVVEQGEHFTFEPLEVFQRDIQKIAAAAGRVKHPELAQVVMKAEDFGQRFAVFALLFKGQRGGLHLSPFGAQRFDDSRQHQPFDIGARGVMGTELVALMRVEGALQQGAEDGGFNIAPVGFGGLNQQVELVASQRNGAGVGKQPAIEAQHLAAQNRRETPGVHVLPQVFQHGGKGVG